MHDALMSSERMSLEDEGIQGATKELPTGLHWTRPKLVALFRHLDGDGDESLGKQEILQLVKNDSVRRWFESEFGAQVDDAAVQGYVRDLREGTVTYASAFSLLPLLCFA